MSQEEVKFTPATTLVHSLALNDSPEMISSISPLISSCWDDKGREKDEHDDTPLSGDLSPLLLVTEEITPITSREEESVLFSDSDVGSVTNGSTRRRESGEKKTKKGISSSRRRRSDTSERSNRSVRSTSMQREKVSPTTKIFRNLLILEESLRQQSTDQRTLKRKFTLFLASLAGFEAFAVYSLYFVAMPTSSYARIFLQFLFLFVLVTLVLFHLSGEYRRTIVIPRKFFTSTNKGLRKLNLRLVKVQQPISDSFIDYWRSILRIVVEVLKFTLILAGPLKNTGLALWLCRRLRDVELRAQPRVGATDVKLVLNARAFNSEIREAWELYRDEFWAKEGSRRRHQVNEEAASLSQRGLQGQDVLDKTKLVEKHRKERRDRRRSKIDQDGIMSSNGELKTMIQSKKSAVPSS